jgi:hypothetical protein
VPAGVSLNGRHTSPVAPGRGAPQCCSLRSGMYWLRADSLGYGLQRPTWLVSCGGVRAQVSANGGAYRDVLLSCGGLELGASSVGNLPVPPSVTLLRSPSFSGERCPGVHPSIHSFNRSPGHDQGIRCTNLSEAGLPASGRGLFARGSSGFHHRALCEVFPFSCAGRGADPTPDSGPGAKLLVPTNRQSRTFPSGWRCACSRWVGGLLEDRSLPPRAEPGWRPPECCASASILLFSVRMSRFSSRNTDGGTSPTWAFTKASSSSADIQQAPVPDKQTAAFSSVS